MSSRVEHALLGLVALCVALVGAAKPVHMDDAAFLRVAQQMRAHPGDPYGFAWSYLGEATPAAVGMPHPPLWPGALALALAWGGENALALHVPSAIAALALALGLVRWLPRAEERRARWLIALSPVLAVSLQSSMSDAPALALGVLGLGTLAQAQRRASCGGALRAGLYLAAAGLTRYAALAFLAAPLAVALGPAREPRGGGERGRALLSALVPLAVAALFQLWFAARYGATHWASLAGYVRFEELRAPELRVLAFLPALAVAAPAALAALVGPLRRRAAVALLAVGACAGAYGALRSSAVHGIAYDAPHWALLLALTTCGLALPIAAARASRTAGERALLAAVALALLAAAPAGAARYALPLALCCVVALRAPLAALSTRAFGAALAAQLVLLAALSAADLRAARRASELYAAAADSFATEPAAPWVRGELGLRYELERRGARYLDAHERGVHAGEPLVRSERATPGDTRFSPRVEAALPAAAERELRAEDPFPLRLHQPYAGAGFHGHRAGLLPFAFSRAPHEVVRVHRFREAPDLLDLSRAEFLAAAENPALAADFERYARVRPASPAADIELETALHLVARRASGGAMALRFALDLPAEEVRLVGRWAEPARLTEDAVPGGASELEVRVIPRDGGAPELLLRSRSAARRGADERRWHPLELDLAPLRGRAVWVELACLVPAEEPAPDAVAYAILAALDLVPSSIARERSR